MTNSSFCLCSFGILGEIYRYRTRSGVYQPRLKNEALHAVLNNTQLPDHAKKNTGPAADKKEGNANIEPRTIFWEQVCCQIGIAETYGETEKETYGETQSETYGETQRGTREQRSKLV